MEQTFAGLLAAVLRGVEAAAAAGRHVGDGVERRLLARHERVQLVGVGQLDDEEAHGYVLVLLDHEDLDLRHRVGEYEGQHGYDADDGLLEAVVGVGGEQEAARRLLLQVGRQESRVARRDGIGRVDETRDVLLAVVEGEEARRDLVAVGMRLVLDLVTAHAQQLLIQAQLRVCGRRLDLNTGRLIGAGRDRVRRVYDLPQVVVDVVHRFAYELGML